MKKNTKLALFVMLGTVGYSATLMAVQSNVCKAAHESYQPLKAVSVEGLSQAEIERIGKERPCLKSYPWPPGEFLVDDDYMGKGVDADRMGEIRRFVDRIVDENPDNGGIILRLYQTKNEHEKEVLRALLDGRRRDLLPMFGTFLHLVSLRKEGRYEEMLRLAESASLSAGRAADAPFDEMEEGTYYRKQRLANMFALTKFVALAELKGGSAEESAKQLGSFLKIRPMLAAEIGIMGDPAESLFWRASCELP